MNEEKKPPIYPTIAAFCLMGIGITLTRFAYGPLIPSLIDSGWTTKPQAAYLGASATLGYIIACLGAIWLPRLISIRFLLYASLVMAVVGLGMCVWNFGFAWLLAGRLLSGFAGAAMVIHSPSLLFAHINEEDKGWSSGLAFSGAGVMIVVVSLLLPPLIVDGPSKGWLLEAFLALILGLVAFPLVRKAPHQPLQEKVTPREAMEPLARDRKHLILLLGIAYVLAGFGITPHVFFLSDYMHRDLGVSMAQSSILFSLLGLGAAIGALTSGSAIKFFGTRASLPLNGVIGVIAVVMVLVSKSVIVVTGSGLLLGVFLLQCIPLASMRTLEVVSLPCHSYYWGYMTLGLGLGMVTGSYGMAGLLSRGFQYIDLFRVGLIALSLSLALNFFAYWWFRRIS